MDAYSHARTHAGRTVELAAEAATERLARAAAPAAPALRDRLGRALIAAGVRLTRPAHAPARVQRRTA
ncbi:hypothetical protein AB0P12_31075 [Streptomyces subrutilus]|uniref:hypothetical protein n=1 Tax=Streptomyces subrutilus TaxID=36818 RepID=UPI0033E90312